MSNAEGISHTAASDAIELALLKPVGSVESVLDNFAEIKPYLGSVGLAHVEPFWETYGDVSATVYDGLGTGRFYRDKDVMHTLPIFYNQARKPLLAYVQDVPRHMAPEWHRSLYSTAVTKAAPGVQFLMHMNAHINNDLARALDISGVHDDYKHDYTTIVGEILEEVAMKHAGGYIPLRSSYMRQMALKTCLQYIGIARERAWHDGKVLQAVQEVKPVHDNVVRKIEQRALLQGKIMLFASSLLLKTAAQTDQLTGRFSKSIEAA